MTTSTPPNPNDLIKNLSLRADSLPQIKSLITTQHADPSHTDVNGDTALQRAIVAGNVPVLRYYIEECGMDVNYINKQGLSYLMLAVQSGQFNVVRYLMEDCPQDVDLEHSTPDGKTYMDFIEDHDWQIQEYLTSGANDTDDITDLEAFRKRRLREAEQDVEIWKQEAKRLREKLEALENGTGSGTSTAPRTPGITTASVNAKAANVLRALQQKAHEAQLEAPMTTITNFQKTLEDLATFEDLIASWRISVNPHQIDTGGFCRELYQKFMQMLNPPYVDLVGRLRLPSDAQDCTKQMRSIGKMMMRYLLLDIPCAWLFAKAVFAYILGKEPYDVYGMMDLVREFNPSMVSTVEEQLQGVTSTTSGEQKSNVQREVCDKLEAQLYGSKHREANLDALKEGFFSCVPQEMRRQIESLNAAELKSLLQDRFASFNKDGVVKRLLRNLKQDATWDAHAKTRQWLEEWLRVATREQMAAVMFMMSGMCAYTGRENVIAIPSTSNRFHGYAAHFVLEVACGYDSKEEWQKALEQVLGEHTKHITYAGVILDK